MAVFSTPDIRDLALPSGIGWSDALADRVAHRIVHHWRAHGFGHALWMSGAEPAALAGLQFAVVRERPVVELSFAVLPRFRRLGLARMAVLHAMSGAPDISGTIAAAARPGNSPAIAILRANGFQDDPARADQADPAGQDEDLRLFRWTRA